MTTVPQSEGLQYFGSSNIVAFCKANPTSWNIVDRGSIGDRMPPELTVSHVFWRLLNREYKLFSQSELWEECTRVSEWSTWLSSLSAEEKTGFRWKIFSNFWPSFMDQLHVWSLFVEARWFDTCRIDAAMDAYGKHDLLVSMREYQPIAIHLTTNSPRAKQVNAWKASHRASSSPCDYQVYHVELPVCGQGNRPKDYPENKRWFCLKDFEHIYAEYCNRHSLWDTFAVPCTCGHHNKKSRRLF